MIQNVMSLCDKSGQFLFHVLPDKFPAEAAQGRVGETEMLLWEKYYTRKKAEADRRRRRQG